jgi:hypothetical protein
MDLNKHHVTKASEEFRVFTYTFFTLTVVRVEWMVSGPCYFTFLKRPPVLIGQV